MTTPNPYLSKASLAKALEVSPSTIDEMVRRGVLPRPARLSSGCVRWRWETVDLALMSLIPGSNAVPTDDAVEGAKRVIEAAKAGRGGWTAEEEAGVQRAIQAAKEGWRGRRSKRSLA